MAELSDVTAVILSLGEATLSQAIEQVKSQTRPPVEIILIEGIMPFHAAFNLGVSKVRTPFFVQVDADMLLDVDCFRSLRNAVRDDVGIVVGWLEDDLMGQIEGVKLFRTSCFADTTFPDSIAPDTDFLNTIAKSGWRTIYAGRQTGGFNKVRRSLGKHSREYQPQYTFHKYLLVGSRHVHRQNPQGHLWHLRCLSKSRHPSARLAMIAFCQGIFLEANRDLLRPNEAQLVAQYNSYEEFAGSTDKSEIPTKMRLSVRLPILQPSLVFEHYFRAGSQLRAAGRFARFEQLFSLLWKYKDKGTWLATVGLSHGIFYDQLSQDDTSSEWRKLEAFCGDIYASKCIFCFPFFPIP